MSLFRAWLSDTTDVRRLGRSRPGRDRRPAYPGRSRYDDEHAEDRDPNRARRNVVAARSRSARSTRCWRSGIATPHRCLPLTFLPEAPCPWFSPSRSWTVLSRAWHARRGGLEYGSFRIPSAVNCGISAAVPQPLAVLGVVGAALLAGTFALVPAGIALVLSLPLPDQIPTNRW